MIFKYVTILFLLLLVNCDCSKSSPGIKSPQGMVWIPDGTFMQSKMISIFCNIPLADAYRLKVNSVSQIVSILTEMLSVTPERVERFNIGDIEYGIIPDLNDMSLGEYIDLDASIGDWDNMHKAMN